MRIYESIFIAALLAFSLPTRAEQVPRADACEAKQASLFAALSQLPSLPYVAVEGGGYRPTSMLLAAVLGASPRSLILNSSDELRYITATLYRSPLILVIDAAKDFDQQKLNKVLAVAKLQEISISLLWLSNAVIPSELEALVAASGGKVWKQTELKAGMQAYACAKP